ncbi:hypothetical protein CCR94_01010 [Rhodoblastus sphagnicola]|uniref:Uncharacterized protein n=1 Tax=Rhodoblastus sphagnicola TaxID=333368 RepID=A0A2S6NGF4_9HYPH|nr:hypothetical protein [Rhodoblastus sphagnicola]MBB4200895.1 hypothetical protein [Rhodoblastus sphagnicola]PPQ33664.1 hypothetical protein CCR94_01010 [Rhodoblastus sphagnicola]
MPNPENNPSPKQNPSDAPLDTREALIKLIALAQGIDHGQNAGLEATGMLREEIGALHGLLAHLIEILTPAQPENEGPSLRELISLMIQQQREMARLLKELVTAARRIETHLGTATTPPAVQKAQ